MKLNKNYPTYYYLDVAMQFFLILALTLVPIYFTTMIHNSFTIEKHVIFRVCVLLMFAIGVIKYSYFSARKLPKVFWLMPLFGLVGVLSTIFSINPAVSLWGIHLRMDGLVNMLFLVMFFVLAYLQLDTKTKIKQVILAIVLGSIIPVVYAIMQKIGADPLEWKGVNAEERVFGTTGNPAYLGAYLLFTIPLTCYLGIKYNSLKKYFFYVLGLASIYVLILTWTRAAYLALGLEISILAMAYFWMSHKKRLFYVFSGLILAGILFVGALNVNPGLVNTLGNNRYLERLSQLTQTTEGTGKDRLEMWKISVKAIEERPLLGAGLSQYIQYFNKYYPNYMDARPDKDRYSNYSHNLWLDTGVAHGLAGILVLLSIYASFIWLGLKKMRAQETLEEKFLYLSVIVAILGYLTQAMFNIETIITWEYSFGLLAVLLAMVNLNEEQELHSKSPTVWKQILTTVLVVAGLVGVYFLAINPWSADKNYFYVNSANLPIDQKLALAQEAEIFTPYFEYAPIRIGDIYASQIDLSKTQEATDLFTNSVEQVNKALAINPLNYKNYMSLATIYGSWARIDNTKLVQAEEHFKKAKTMSPNRLDLHWTWGNVYLDLNMVDKAHEQYEEARKLNPEIGETYFNLAKVAILQGEQQQADEFLQTALDKGYVYEELKFYQDMALMVYKQSNFLLAGSLAGRANEISVSEMSAMIEIQANLELDQSDVAGSLLNEYSKLVPGLEEKFQQ